MANKGKKGALECRARDWACALRWCACVSVCMCVDVLVLVFVCLCSGVVLVLVAFALMSSVMGHSLDWPWNGPVSRLWARTDGTGAPWYLVSLAFSAQNSSKLRSQEIRERVRDRVGLEPVARWPPWLPAWGRRLSSAPGSLLPGRYLWQQTGRAAQVPQLPQLLHDRPGPHNTTGHNTT